MPNADAAETLPALSSNNGTASPIVAFKQSSSVRSTPSGKGGADALKSPFKTDVSLYPSSESATELAR